MMLKSFYLREAVLGKVKGREEGGSGDTSLKKQDRKVKVRGGRRMRGHESKKAKRQNTPSVEENRAVETLAAFFQGLFFAGIGIPT